jgi:outer membrane biosynthesis protein TonB
MSGFKSAESSATTLSTDKNVLYIMLIIAVVNVLGYLMMGNFEAVVFFAIVAYLSTFFTKNMVFVFLIAILATNFLMASKVNYFKTNAKEGMKNKDAKDADAKDADAKPSPTPSTKPSPTPSTKPSPTPSTKPSPSPTPSTKPSPKPTTKASKKTSGEKKMEGMNGKLAPAKFNITNDDSEDDDGDAAPFPSSKAQEARNVEKAHDNLQNIGGMSAQTEQVMQQQKILMDNMKTMQPFLETAERFLDKFNMKGIDGLLGKIGLGGAPGQNASS